MSLSRVQWYALACLAKHGLDDDDSQEAREVERMVVKNLRNGDGEIACDHLANYYAKQLWPDKGGALMKSFDTWSWHDPDPKPVQASSPYHAACERASQLATQYGFGSYLIYIQEGHKPPVLYSIMCTAEGSSLPEPRWPMLCDGQDVTLPDGKVGKIEGVRARCVLGKVLFSYRVLSDNLVVWQAESDLMAGLDRNGVKR